MQTFKVGEAPWEKQESFGVGSAPWEKNISDPVTRGVKRASAIESQQGKNTGIRGFSVGVAKGELSTLKGLGTIGQTVLDQTAGRLVNLSRGKGFVPTGPDGSVSDLYRKNTDLSTKADDLLAPNSRAESVGKTTEQIAEFFIPAGFASKGEKAISILASGIKNPLLKAGANIVGKSVVQGTAAGTVRAVQTGGDIKETTKTAALAGGTRGVFATTGEIARGFKLPERLYSIIFKNSKSDMLSELRADGISNLQKTKPELFDQFVKNGIIKIQDGKPLLNETVAEQALNRGLRGSLKSMSNEVVQKTLQSEDDLQRIVSKSDEVVDVSEEQFTKVLKSIAQEYEDVGFGEISAQADDLATRISNSKGRVDAKTALELRRFLDRMRIGASFDRPATKLSLTQSNFKTLSDTVRSRLNKINGVSEIMKDYSFYIDALDELAREATRRGNNQIIGMIDSIFLGSAALSPEPTTAITIGTIRKFLSTPRGITWLGQFLKNSEFGTRASGILQGTTGGISGGESNQ